MLLNHVMVAVTDMDRSVAFYEGLGFELIVRGSHDDTDTYARFVLPGDATLSLHVDNAPERDDHHAVAHGARRLGEP